MFSVAFFVFLEAALLVSSSASCCQGNESETDDYDTYESESDEAETDECGTRRFPTQNWYIESCKYVGTVDVGIYIVVDTAYKRLLSKSHSDVTSYLEVLLNNAEALFWQFECPDVKFTLLGVKELTEQEEKSFKKYKTFKYDSAKKLDPVFTLAMFNRWVNNTNQCEPADVVYLLTSDSIHDFMGAYTPEMKAASYFFGSCAGRRTALSTDDGETFSGVFGMVQQLARLFGIPWDDSPAGPCSIDDGYIMSKNGESTKLAKFSCCSYGEWTKEFLYLEMGKKCYSRIYMPMPSENNKLPADFYNASEYCKIFSGRKEARTCLDTADIPQLRTDVGKNEDDAACQLQCCFNQTNVTINSPDGMICGEEKVCIHGVCVSKKTTWIVSNSTTSDEEGELYTN